MAFAMPSLADNVKIGGINYRISGSTATVMPNNYDDSSGSVIVIGLNNGYEGDVVIPETITVDGVSYEVTSAFEGTFSNSTKLTSVSLPSTLTDLGSTPFSSCNKLLSINVSPDNPTYSSVDGVLYNKAKSTLISCPGGKTAHFEVPSGVTEIANSAFYGCSKLTSVHLPSTIQRLGVNAFRACILMAEVNIPAGITELENGVFRGCSSLKEIEVPSSVTKLGDYAFYYCQSLTNIHFAGPVTSIGSYGLSSCVKLTTIELPSTLESLGDRVFESDSKLVSVSFPSTLKSLGMANFRGCTALTSIEVAEGNDYFTSVDGVLFNKSMDKLICCPSQRHGVYEVPSTVKRIDDYAFFTCRYLSNIKLPLSLTEIGLSAFANCSNLSVLTLPNAVRRIDKSAFITCTSLERIVSYNTVPPILTSTVFSSRTYSLPLQVPSSAITSYKNSDEWENFTNVQAIGEAVIGSVSKAYAGTTTSIEVNLQNAQTNVSEYSVTLQLPEGMRPILTEGGQPVCRFTSRHSDSQPRVSLTPTPDGCYTLNVVNEGNKLTGNDGNVFSLIVMVDADVETTLQTGYITTGSISYSDGSSWSLAGDVFYFNVEKGLVGDVDNDGRVNVMDVTLTVNEILGISMDTFIWQLSDVNHDGILSVVDVMGIVDIILGSE